VTSASVQACLRTIVTGLLKKDETLREIHEQVNLLDGSVSYREKYRKLFPAGTDEPNTLNLSRAVVHASYLLLAWLATWEEWHMQYETTRRLLASDGSRRDGSAFHAVWAALRVPGTQLTAGGSELAANAVWFQDKSGLDNPNFANWTGARAQDVRTAANLHRLAHHTKRSLAIGPRNNGNPADAEAKLNKLPLYPIANWGARPGADAPIGGAGSLTERINTLVTNKMMKNFYALVNFRPMTNSHVTPSAYAPVELTAAAAADETYQEAFYKAGVNALDAAQQAVALDGVRMPCIMLPIKATGLMLAYVNGLGAAPRMSLQGACPMGNEAVIFLGNGRGTVQLQPNDPLVPVIKNLLLKVGKIRNVVVKCAAPYANAPANQLSVYDTVETEFV
jgi:hypothetical protein